MNKEKSINRGLMTEGVIWKEILLFSIPLLLGNLFQQLYNAVDSVVVGNYIGAQALAAVGSSAPVINLLVSFFMGLAVGAGVIISRYFGARKRRAAHRRAYLAGTDLCGRSCHDADWRTYFSLCTAMGRNTK